MNFAVKTPVMNESETSLNNLRDEKKVLVVDDSDFYIDAEKSALSQGSIT